MKGATNGRNCVLAKWNLSSKFFCKFKVIIKLKVHFKTHVKTQRQIKWRFNKSVNIHLVEYYAAIKHFNI